MTEYYDRHDSLDASHGFNVAAAVLGFSDNGFYTEDPQIGQLHFSYFIGGNRFVGESLPTRPCTQADFNSTDDSQNQSKFFKLIEKD